MSGAELGTDKLPGKAGTDYVLPDDATLKYFAGMGMTAIRLPVLWERLQPDLGGKLDAQAAGQVDRVITQAAALHLRVIIDLHDYGMWRGISIGKGDVSPSAFADFWKTYVRHVDTSAAGRTAVFGLMNEPHDIDGTAWAAAEQGAIDAIRSTGADNLILVSGTGWDGAHNFVSGAGYGVANAVTLGKLHDPRFHMAIEMHQYLDGDYSGTSAACMAPAQAAATLAAPTAWLRAHGLHAFLGEFAASSARPCLASLDALLNALDANSDVWIGWTYWAAGPWWGSYMFSVQPHAAADGTLQDAPQTAVLRRHLPGRT